MTSKKHPSAWWITFQTGRPACVEAEDEASALKLAHELAGRPALQAERLPYPAAPRLNMVPYGDSGPCPSFCYKPTECKGKTYCPQRYSCTE